MYEYKTQKLDGAKIFKLAIEKIKKDGWNHNSMDILLSVTPGSVWPQPMAIMMYIELTNVLGEESLTAFDHRVKSKKEVIQLFQKVIDSIIA